MGGVLDGQPGVVGAVMVGQLVVSSRMRTRVAEATRVSGLRMWVWGIE